jgi:hypothetical protein
VGPAATSADPAPARPDRRYRGEGDQIGGEDAQADSALDAVAAVSDAAGDDGVTAELAAT